MDAKAASRFDQSFLSAKVGIIIVALSFFLGSQWSLTVAKLMALESEALLHLGALFAVSGGLWSLIWKTLGIGFSKSRALFFVHVLATSLTPIAAGPFADTLFGAS